MVSLLKYGDHQNKAAISFICKSTDEKPVKVFNGIPISNGSTLYEINTKKKFMYDEDTNTWLDVTSSGSGGSGVDGITPTIGDNGNWFLGETDTGKPSRGADGVTPTIGTNGNWFLGETDTGKPSQGTKIYKPGSGISISDDGVISVSFSDGNGVDY